MTADETNQTKAHSAKSANFLKRGIREKDYETKFKLRWPDQNDLRSDHLPNHTCSRKGFGCTSVWKLIWSLSDQRWLWSGTV